MAARSFTLPDERVLSYNLSPSPSSGPLVLLANSLTTDLTSWDHVVGRLTSSGFRVLRFDQPGHGGSSAPKDLSSTTFASMADDVAALLKHLNLSKLHAWVGVSMGAALSIYFVAKYPGVINRVVICDTISASPANAGVPDVFGDRVAAARKEGSLQNTRQGTLNRWFSKDWIAANPKEADRLNKLMSTTTLDGFEACCAALRSNEFNVDPILKKIATGCDDALLIVGERDADLPVKMQGMKDKIQEGFTDAGSERNVELKVIKNAGHLPFIDRFEEFCEVVIPFLQK